MSKPKPDPFESLPPIDGERLASELNVKIRRVQQLVVEGLPQLRRNAYDLLAAFRWYVRHVQAALHRRENIESESPSNSYRDRLMAAQAERAEMDLLRVRGELIPLAAYEQHMTALVIAARERFLQLPGRLAGLIVSLENPADRAAVKRICDEEIRHTLALLGTPPNGNNSAIPGNAVDAVGSGPPRLSPLSRAASASNLGVGERK